MGLLFKLLKSISRLPVGLQSLILDITFAISRSADPYRAARDAKKAAIVHTFDAIMRSKKEKEGGDRS